MLLLSVHKKTPNPVVLKNEMNENFNRLHTQNVESTFGLLSHYFKLLCVWVKFCLKVKK